MPFEFSNAYAEALKVSFTKEDGFFDVVEQDFSES